MYRAIQSYYQQKQYDFDCTEIIVLRMQLASEDQETSIKAYALLHGIKWGTLAQIEVDQYLFEFRQKLTPDELIEIKNIQSKIPLGNPLPTTMSGLAALLMFLILLAACIFLPS